MNLGLINQAGKFTQGGLMVIGASVLGALIIGFIISSLSTLVTGRRLPGLVVRWVRICSALATGAAVAMIVFGSGGGFGSGGSGTGNTIHAPTQAKSSDAETPNAPPRIGITILGGSRVRGVAFYQLDTDVKPKTQDELKPLFKQTAAGTIALRLYDDSVARDHAATTELIALAEQHGWKVIVEEFKGQSLPPEAKP